VAEIGWLRWKYPQTAPTSQVGVRALLELSAEPVSFAVWRREWRLAPCVSTIPSPDARETNRANNN